MATSITDSYVDADCFNEKICYKNQAYFTNCNPVYLFTNDNVKPMIENMNLSGKLLSVTASFDHQLNAILMGAKDITSFDINNMAKYFAELKLQAVKCLNYEEFINFYKLHRRPGKKIKCAATYKNLDKKTVYKLCENMDYTLSFFFDRLITLGFFDKADSTGYYAYITKPSMNMYLNNERYYDLQEKIKDVTFQKYIDCNLLALKEHIGNDMYSAMIFSNITSYFKGSTLEMFGKLLKELESNLEDNGSIQIGEGFINNTVNVIGGDPIDRNFILRYKDNIEEIKTKKEIMTYYYK